MLVLFLWYIGPPSVASNFTDVKAEKQALSGLLYGRYIGGILISLQMQDLAVWFPAPKPPSPDIHNGQTLWFKFTSVYGEPGLC